MIKYITIIIAIFLMSFDIYAQTPTIISFSPDSGSAGTLLTIIGTTLSNPTSLIVGGVSPIVVSNTGDTLVALIMPGAVTGVVSITTSGGTATGSHNFTIIPTPFPSVQQGNKLVGIGVGPSYQGGAVSISADGNTAIVGGDNDNSRVGAAWIYTRTGTTWSQQGPKLVGTGAVGLIVDQGASVSLSADGNTAIVGGPGDNDGIGAVWIFHRTDTTWSQQGLNLVGSGYIGGNGGNSAEGTSVSLSADGNTAMVGGPRDNDDTGAVWVFIRTGNTWSQQGPKIVGAGGVASVGEPGQGSSVSLSADGNTAIVGAASDSGSGAAWIFIRTDTIWSQQGPKLVGTGAVGGSYQGSAVSISADGNTAMVGGWNDNYGIGAVWVFTRTDSIWPQQGSKLVGTGAIWPAGQGHSVALSADGNTAIIGGPNDSIAGATWVFSRTGSIWSQQGPKLVGAEASGNSLQGEAVSLSADGSTAIIGGLGDNNSTGAAWIFIDSSVTTGIADTKEPNTELTIYPNPTNDYLYISIPGNDNSMKQVEIVNMFGQVVGMENTSDNLLRLDCSGFPVGVYIVSVRMATNSYSSKLVIN